MLLMISRQALERISVLAIVDRGECGQPVRHQGDRRIWLPSAGSSTGIRVPDFLDTAQVPRRRDRLRLAVREADARGARRNRHGIDQKGIRPSLDSAASTNWWLTTDENWAQVCHAGLSAAAIALAERAPELARP